MDPTSASMSVQPRSSAMPLMASVHAGTTLTRAMVADATVMGSPMGRPSAAVAGSADVAVRATGPTTPSVTRATLTVLLPTSMHMTTSR